MRLSFFIILYNLFCIDSTTFAQSKNDLFGIWHNGLKETLTIAAISSTGEIAGTYVGSHIKSEKIFQLVGWVDPIRSSTGKDDIVPIIMMVQLNPNGSVITWAGYLAKSKSGGLAITAIWKVIRATADPDNDLTTNMIDSVIFRPGPAD